VGSGAIPASLDIVLRGRAVFLLLVGKFAGDGQVTVAGNGLHVLP